MTKHILLYILFAFLVVSIFGVFGKNKVNYYNYEWKIYEDDSFRLYYYEKEDDLVQKAIPIIRTTILEYSKIFDVKISNKIPIIFYHNVYKFRETNIIPYIIPEGVGGFTEYSKGRVVVPFNGSFYDFEHVLRHELVHEFVMIKKNELNYYSYKFESLNIPLWFHEGLAEYLSVGITQSDKVFLSHMLKNDLYVSLKNINLIYGTFLMYKEGQFFIDYLVKNYGHGIITKYMNSLKIKSDFVDNLEYITGKEYNKIVYGFELWLKNQFLFSSNDYKNYHDYTKIVKKDALKYYKTGENKSVFITDKWGYIDIYKKEGKRKKRILRIGNKENYEFLSIKKMPVYYLHKKLYIAIKYKNRDSIIVINLNNNKIEKKFNNIKNIELINSITVKNDNIYFTGLSSDGYNKIMKINNSNDSVQEIYQTNKMISSLDIFNNNIIFNMEIGKYGYKKLFFLNINSNKIYQISYGKFNDYKPIFDDQSGDIYFLSDRNGTINIYKISKKGYLYKITEFPVYINDMWLSSNNIYFSTFIDNKKICKLIKKDNDILDEDIEYINNPEFEYEKISLNRLQVKSRSYDPKLTLDFTRANISSDPKIGYSGDISLLFADMLNNYELYTSFGISRVEGSFKSIIRDSNYYLNFISRKNRLNYYLSIYHFYLPMNYYRLIVYDEDYNERIAGGEAGFVFPFSKFRRLSAGININFEEREYFYYKEWKKIWYAGFTMEYVFDNTLWNNVGPIDGWRYNIKLNTNFNIDDKIDNVSNYYSLDYRRYFRVFKNSSFAFRGNYAESFGKKDYTKRLTMGGSLSMRGYDYYSFNGTKLLLLNAEYRFLLIKDIKIGIADGKIRFPSIYSSLFFDAGNCWHDNENNNLKGSLGISFQMGFNALALRYDIARKTNFEELDDSTSHEFTMGWNF